MSLWKCHTFGSNLRAIQQNSSHHSIRHHSNHRSSKRPWCMSVQIRECPSLRPISSFQALTDQFMMFSLCVRLWHLCSHIWFPWIFLWIFPCFPYSCLCLSMRAHSLTMTCFVCLCHTIACLCPCVHCKLVENAHTRT